MAVAITGVWDATRSDDASAGVLSVVKSGDFTTVRLEDLRARPDQIESELNSAGFNSRVSSVAVATPVVGYLVSVAAPSGLEPVGLDGGVYREFRIRDSMMSDLLELNVGRVAQAGEPYAVAFNAFAPGGPLYCSNVYGAKVSDVRTKIEMLDLETQWRRISTFAGSENVAAGDALGDVVVYAFMPQEGMLIVHVAPSLNTSVARPEHVGDKC